MPTMLSRARVAQLPLFHRPQRIPRWSELPPDVQEKTLRLLAQLMRRHRSAPLAAERTQEGCDD